MALKVDERDLALRVLGAADWFRHSGDRSMDVLLAQARTERCVRGQVVFLHGDPVRELVVVLEGRLELSMVGADGRKMATPPAPPGEAIALIPLLDGGGALYNVRASARSVLLRIPKDALLAAMQADVLLLQAVLGVLVVRARRANEWRIHAALHGLRARLARQLIFLAQAASGRAELRLPVDLRLTQDDIAAILGVTRQTVNAEIRAMEAQGLLALGYGRVRLLDGPGLTAAAAEVSDR
jgi:CRP/FNR family transcriptional regulator, cyclic AMP receptor protein